MSGNRASLAALAMLPMWLPAVRAQMGSGAPAGEVPKQVIQDAVDNEIKLIQYDNSYLRYRVHTRDAKGDRVREVVESKDGTVARVVMKDDHPLSPEDDSAEHSRLQGMLDSPTTFRRHIEKDQSGKKLAVDLVKLMPDAMLYEFVPGQPQRGDKPAATPAEYVIDFKPNPSWNPPTMTSEALTGIEGRCWIDQKTHHMTRMEAKVFQGVNVGWGMVAHIYPGGVFTLEQEQVGEHRWCVDHFVEHVTVRALMVKTVSENTDMQAFEFSPIPAMGYQDAIHLLLSTRLPGVGVQASK